MAKNKQKKVCLRTSVRNNFFIRFYNYLYIYYITIFRVFSSDVFYLYEEDDSMEDKYYTLEEISVILKTPILYLRRMVREEKLIAHKIGRNYKVKESDIKKYVDSCRYKNDR